MRWYKFVLYCHIVRSDRDGLVAVGEELQELLDQNQGLMVLFVDTGLPDLLKMIHPIKRDLDRIAAQEEKRKLKEELAGRSSELRAGSAFGSELESQLGKNVRVLTALDLVDVFGEMSAVEDLKKFLIGMQSEMRYDTPKFIESIVRLRMIGSRVPVLRLDRDVLIPGEDDEFDVKALDHAITKICDEVVNHHDSFQVLATILSVNYKSPGNGDDPHDWNRSSATRILPSLLVPTPEDAATLINAGEDVDWSDALQRHFSPELTKRFYREIWEWGAPTTAVISGALLYMNDAVVLNVPPFSNFSRKVMWIDDHLRYVLHREMGDFCRQTQTAWRTDKLLHVQYSSVQISKYRKADEFLLFTLRTYLPSLLWGSFFDYWLCPSPLLKRRTEDVPSHEQSRWRDERLKGYPGVLVGAIREARAGCLPDEALLRENLKNAANERLEVLLTAWGELKVNGSHSFASAWVHDAFPEPIKEALRAAPRIAPKLPESVEEFQDDLKDGFNEVLDDTCRYVKWVFEWPRVVSVIRSVPPGHFRSDLEWAG